MLRPLKIGFLIQEFPKISETFIFNQIKGLSGMGHDIRVLSMDRPSFPFDSSGLEFQIKYVDLPQEYSRRIIKLPRIALRSGPQEFGTILSSLSPLRFGVNALSLRLAYLADKIKFIEDTDVLICHFGDIGLLGSDLKQLGYHGKVITFFHGYDVSNTFKDNGIYRRLFQHGDLFMPVSHFWEERLKEIGCPADRLEVHHMGIDAKKFKCVIRKKPIDEKTRIISVGRLVEKKGHEYAIRAIKKLIEADIDIEYVIIGDGPLRRYLEEVVLDLGIYDEVVFTGEVTESELLKYYKESHILVLPSVTASSGDMEGIPMVIMEAMAMGMPIVSTFHSGIPELVQDGVTGYLVPERDVGKLADVMKTLIAESAQWKMMGEAGRNKVVNDFNLDKLNHQLVSKIYQLIDRS